MSNSSKLVDININETANSIISNKWLWIFVSFIIILCILFYSVFYNPLNKENKLLMKEINQNNIKIEKLNNSNNKLQQQYVILEKQNDELNKKINNIKEQNKIDTDSAAKKEKEIINSSQSVKDNIEYLNKKYGVK